MLTTGADGLAPFFSLFLSHLGYFLWYVLSFTNLFFSVSNLLLMPHGFVLFLILG